MLDAAGIANGRLNDPRDAGTTSNSAHATVARGRHSGWTSPRLLPPFTFTDFEAAMGDVPAVGQHTDPVLADSISPRRRSPRCTRRERYERVDPAPHRMVPEQRWFEDFQFGERFVLPSRTMTEGLFRAFQAASGDNHPVHYTSYTAARTGFPGCSPTGFRR